MHLNIELLPKKSIATYASDIVMLLGCACPSCWFLGLGAGHSRTEAAGGLQIQWTRDQGPGSRDQRHALWGHVGSIDGDSSGLCKRALVSWGIFSTAQTNVPTLTVWSPEHLANDVTPRMFQASSPVEAFVPVSLCKRRWTACVP